MQLNVCTKYMRNIRREIVKQNQNKRNIVTKKKLNMKDRKKNNAKLDNFFHNTLLENYSSYLNNIEICNETWNIGCTIEKILQVRIHLIPLVRYNS